MLRGGRTGRMSRVALAAMAVIAAAACSPNEGPDVAESSGAGSSTADSVASTGGSIAPSTSTPSGAARAAARWEPIAEGADPDDLPDAPPGELTLDACRWRAGSAFSFDLTWSPAGGDGAAAQVPLALGFVIGDQAVAAVGTATFVGAGAYTVDAVIRTGDDDGNDSERAARRPNSLTIGDLPCSGSTLGAVESPLGSALLVADPRPADARADTGTIEGRAASIDLLDADAPLLPLAWLYADPQPPELDRLYVHPTELLQFLSVKRDGMCIVVRSGWGDGYFSAVVEIVQQVGCPPQLSPDERDTVPIDDDVWDVVVQGPAGTVEAFARELTLLRSEEVAPFDPAATAFDVDRFLDEHLADYELDELQRFDWEGGRVLVAMSVAGLMGLDVLAVTPDGFNGGGSGRPCQDLAISMKADADGRGFVVVAVRGDAIATIDEDGPGSGTPVDIPLAASQVDDILVGFHDLDMPMREFDVERVVVADPDGAPRACVQ